MMRNSPTHQILLYILLPQIGYRNTCRTHHSPHYIHLDGLPYRWTDELVVGLSEVRTK